MAIDLSRKSLLKHPNVSTEGSLVSDLAVHAWNFPLSKVDAPYLKVSEAISQEENEQ